MASVLSEETNTISEKLMSLASRFIMLLGELVISVLEEGMDKIKLLR